MWRKQEPTDHGPHVTDGPELATQVSRQSLDEMATAEGQAGVYHEGAADENRWPWPVEMLLGGWRALCHLWGIRLDQARLPLEQRLEQLLQLTRRAESEAVRAIHSRVAYLRRHQAWLLEWDEEKLPAPKPRPGVVHGLGYGLLTVVTVAETNLMAPVFAALKVSDAVINVRLGLTMQHVTATTVVCSLLVLAHRLGRRSRAGHESLPQGVLLVGVAGPLVALSLIRGVFFVELDDWSPGKSALVAIALAMLNAGLVIAAASIGRDQPSPDQVRSAKLAADDRVTKAEMHQRCSAAEKLFGKVNGDVVALLNTFSRHGHALGAAKHATETDVAAFMMKLRLAIGEPVDVPLMPEKVSAEVPDHDVATQLAAWLAAQAEAEQPSSATVQTGPYLHYPRLQPHAMRAALKQLEQVTADLAGVPTPSVPPAPTPSPPRTPPQPRKSRAPERDDVADRRQAAEAVREAIRARLATMPDAMTQSPYTLGRRLAKEFGVDRMVVVRIVMGWQKEQEDAA